MTQLRGAAAPPPAADGRPTHKPIGRPTRSARGRARRWWRRKPVKRWQMLVHRWAGLVLGLFLVIECTTGVVLLYRGELFRATNGELYHHTHSSRPVGAVQALAAVRRAHPDFAAQWVARDHGVYVVGNATYAGQWFVDPGTGRVNGHADLGRGFLGFLENVHDCALGCATDTGHVSWFAVPVWTGGPTFLTGITRGGLVLGVLGLLMILLVVTSVRIWWPGARRLRTRMTVRRGRGRFARDYDLHNVVGALALPFLLMWGITGAALEFPVVEKAWIALTGGTQTSTPTYSVTPNPATRSAPQLTLAQASAAATRRVPGDISFVGFPTADADYYEFDIVTGYASSAHRLVYRGDAYVYVDAHDAANVASFDSGREPAAKRFYDKFLEPTHFGWNVNGWWRIVWAVLGLAPLALLVTGVSTWLFRRGVTSRRKQATAARAGTAP